MKPPWNCSSLRDLAREYAAKSHGAAGKVGNLSLGVMVARIHEILSTGKLSKLEHFENDEKVKTVSLFGEVWGIGPVTALKLYENGHHTLDDLKQDDSLSTAQKIGLKYFDDIKKRIPRHEVKDMEMLLQKAGQELLPGMIIVCGGSYRRGKASCGDLDIVITHPDGERELRRRIDLKVYPRDRYAFGLIAWTGNDVLNRSAAGMQQHHISHLDPMLSGPSEANAFLE
ncbi:hypothetical protein ZIOFF_028350 [Zingiber officinale]|uniref:DNA polymerase n=1 Tax=Zingiber officinale TaxID=94328 RepID=A0A8J5L3I0_ZINOF|nr:hypothetical protein ZIOFF_028350 [Zingiber officinale]